MQTERLLLSLMISVHHLSDSAGLLVPSSCVHVVGAALAVTKTQGGGAKMAPLPKAAPPPAPSPDPSYTIVNALKYCNKTHTSVGVHILVRALQYS